MYITLYTQLESINMQPWLNGLTAANNVKRCGAKTRRKECSPCKSPGMPNGRCRMHGGKSTGAPIGRLHGRYRHGYYTHAEKQLRDHTSALMLAAKKLCETIAAAN
jgi:hypothetical protein